jgi:hypothetical protein
MKAGRERSPILSVNRIPRIQLLEFARATTPNNNLLNFNTKKLDYKIHPTPNSQSGSHQPTARHRKRGKSAAFQRLSGNKF